MDTRRDLIKNFAVGAAVVTALPSPRAHAATFVDALTSGSDPWWIVAPLRRGSGIGHGWVLQDISSPRRGAVVMQLAHETLDPVQVHLCAHRGSPRGVAYSHFLDFVVMDGGQGDQPTQESLGRALIALAHTVAANELKAEADTRLLGGLLTHRERVGRFGPEGL
jgi:hypothetical protein